MRPARSDRRLHAPHQGRQEGAAGRAPGVVAEAGLRGFERADGPRIAPGIARIFDRRRRRLKLELGDLLDGAFIGEPSCRAGCVSGRRLPGVGADGVDGCGRRGCGWATCCASAGSASATAADAISIGLMRIAPCGTGTSICWRRLLLRQRREEKEPADDQDEHDDEHYHSRHAGGFCRARKPLYSPLRLWISRSASTGRWFSSA